MLTYADVYEEAQAAVGAAYTNVGIVCNRMRLLERAAGAHFTCFNGTQVHIVTQKARAAEAHRGALDVRIRLRGQAHLETAKSLLNLAQVYAHGGDRKSAKALFQRAAAIYTAHRASNHPHSMRANQMLAQCDRDKDGLAWKGHVPASHYAREVRSHTTESCNPIP
jgi:hypothetical protein